MPNDDVKSGLSRERILRAALELIDERGLAKLTMRALGGSLGFEAMSLYRHVDSKAALLDGLHEHVLAQVELPSGSGPWQDRARRLAYAFRDVLAAHPAAIPLFLTRVAVTPGSLRYLEAGLAILDGAGFEPKRALAIFQSLYALVVGHCAFHYGVAANEGPDYALAAGLPHVAALAEIDDYTPEFELQIALDALLLGAMPR